MENYDTLETKDIASQIKELKDKVIDLCISLFFFFLSTLFIMLIWNKVATTLFGLPHLTYWYAAGLYFLSGLLFRGRNRKK